MKAAILTLDTLRLHELLHLPTDVQIHFAQVDYTVYERPVLQLVLMGDSLADDFQVREGDPLRKAMLILERDGDHQPTFLRIQAV
jgi:hypothetical protein